MKSPIHQPLLRKVDCVRFHVADLEAGLAFYRDLLGHELIWRSANAAGLRMPETEAEIVLHTEDEGQKVDFTVDSADEAAQKFESAGGKIIEPPFDNSNWSLRGRSRPVGQFARPSRCQQGVTRY